MMLHDVGYDGLVLGTGGSLATRLESQGLVRATRAGGGAQGPAGSCTFDVMAAHCISSDIIAPPSSVAAA